MAGSSQNISHLEKVRELLKASGDSGNSKHWTPNPENTCFQPNSLFVGEKVRTRETSDFPRSPSAGSQP